MSVPTLEKARCMIVIPTFNEQHNVATIYHTIHQTLSALNDLEVTFVFVNDGSEDDSWSEIRSLASTQNDVIGLDLSRNFGKEAALTAGVRACGDADFVICIDADLQHPPKLIPKMINLWRNGSDTVIGLRHSTPEDGIIRKVGSAVFNRLMKVLSDIDYHRGSTDFRLLDKKVVQAINSLRESQRLFRGLADWVGFQKAYVYFDADERLHGNSTYSIFKLTGLAFVSILAFSVWPLKAIALLGTAILSSSIAVFLFVLIDSLFFGIISASPLAIVVIAIAGILGLITLILGVIALYLAQISREVLQRPSFIIRESVGN